MSTTPNAVLAYRVLDQIDAHPETWNQGTWDCGTAACFAGWAVRLAGGEIDPATIDHVDPIVAQGPEEIVGLAVDVAAEVVLGSACRTGDSEDDDDLFAASNSREDLGRLVAEIFGPRPEVLEHAPGALCPPVNEIDDSLSGPDGIVYAPCQPIGCDAGIHLAGCVYAEADVAPNAGSAS